MTREEQIIEKAGKDSEIFYKVNDNYGDCFHGGFIDGAKWADENPKFSKQKFIEKACEWLKENLSEGYDIDNYPMVRCYDIDMEDFIKEFRREMEE